MLGIDQQLKTSYEEGGLTPEQIAIDQGLDIVAVKAKLMQVSSKYREDAKQEKVEDNSFSIDEDALAKQVILESMLGAERSDGSIDHKTRLSAAIYLRDDKRGRHDRKGLQMPTFNLLQFNQAIVNARQAADRSIEESLGGMKLANSK